MHNCWVLTCYHWMVSHLHFPYAFMWPSPTYLTCNQLPLVKWPRLKSQQCMSLIRKFRRPFLIQHTSRTAQNSTEARLGPRFYPQHTNLNSITDLSPYHTASVLIYALVTVDAHCTLFSSTLASLYVLLSHQSQCDKACEEQTVDWAKISIQSVLVVNYVHQSYSFISRELQNSPF